MTAAATTRRSGLRGNYILREQTRAFERDFAAAIGARYAIGVGSGTAAIDVGNRMSRRTEAIAPVHLYGQPCDLARFVALGKPLIQDACQVHGARSAGRLLTSYSPYVAYSFYPNRNLACLRDGGRGRDHVSLVPGVNSRLDEMQACYLSAFLPQLTEWNARRTHRRDLR